MKINYDELFEDKKIDSENTLKSIEFCGRLNLLDRVTEKTKSTPLICAVYFINFDAVEGILKFPIDKGKKNSENLSASGIALAHILSIQGERLDENVYYEDERIIIPITKIAILFIQKEIFDDEQKGKIKEFIDIVKQNKEDVNNIIKQYSHPLIRSRNIKVKKYNTYESTDESLQGEPMDEQSARLHELFVDQGGDYYKNGSYLLEPLVFLTDPLCEGLIDTSSKPYRSIECEIYKDPRVPPAPRPGDYSNGSSIFRVHHATPPDESYVYFISTNLPNLFTTSKPIKTYRNIGEMEEIIKDQIKPDKIPNNGIPGTSGNEKARESRGDKKKENMTSSIFNPFGAKGYTAVKLKKGAKGKRSSRISSAKFKESIAAVTPVDPPTSNVTAPYSKGPCKGLNPLLPVNGIAKECPGVAR